MSQGSKTNIPIGVWLKTIALPQYELHFRKYRGAEAILNISDKELLKLGVRDVDHRTRITNSLRLLALKCKQLADEQAERKQKETELPLWRERELQAELDAELRLPPSDIRSYAWFHGTVPRPAAEKLVEWKKQFLVRESLSQPDCYVLTCNHLGSALHFVINKFEETFGRSVTVEYGFEGSRYTSIPALIMAHVADGKIITTASQAIIEAPVNRLVPLRLGEKYKQLQHKQSLDYASTFDLSGRLVQRRTSGQSYRSSQSSLNTTQRGSQSSLNKSQTSSYASLNNASRLSQSREQLPRNMSNSSLERVKSTSHLLDEKEVVSSTPSGRDNLLQLPLSPNRAHSEGDLLNSPNAKPERSVQFKFSKAEQHPAVLIRNRELYDAGADYSDYDEVKRMPFLPSQPEVIKPPTRLISNRSALPKRQGNRSNPALHKLNRSTHNISQSPDAYTKESLLPLPQSSFHASMPDLDVGGEDYDTPAADAVDIQQFVKPTIPVQFLNVTGFQSEVITPFNKPLDPHCMYKMKDALFQVSHRIFARHITYLDLHMLKVIESSNLGAGVFSGLETLTLPHGEHFRDAAIERHYSLAYIVAVTILACTDDLVERSQMLKQWLSIANELLRSHGNMFSFAAIIEGIMLPSISRLKMTWNILERSEPVIANLWKTRLRITYKELNMAGSNLPMDNVCIPHILPLCEILERDELTNLTWESQDTDYGLDLMLAHLDLGRIIAGHTRGYSSKGRSVIQGFVPKSDLRDLSKVELHMRLLYGHKGAQAKRNDRRQKFEQILNILSQRAESSDVGTEL